MSLNIKSNSQFSKAGIKLFFCFRNTLDQKNSSQDSKNNQDSNNSDKKKPHIKKPLNAFMLYMKEMRAKVVAECTLKESAAINQILGRRVSDWYFNQKNNVLFHHKFCLWVS